MFYKKLVLTAMFLVMVLMGCMSGKSEMEEVKQGEKRATLYVGSYKNVYFRGTPNSWGTTDMTLVADYTWQTVQVFGSTSTERFKIDVSGNWATSYPTADYVITGGAGLYTITFNEQTKAITAVKEVIPLSTITITSSPNKSYYFVGDSTMDLAGLVVTGTYSNGTTAEMAVTMSNITGFTTSTAGVKTITVTVGGKSATFNITVNEKSIYI